MKTEFMYSTAGRGYQTNPPLLAMDAAGEYRPATEHEVMHAAQGMLLAKLGAKQSLTGAQEVKDFLRLRLGTLEHEVFAVIHLDAENRLNAYVEMFRGSLTQTSVYPREVLKEALQRNSAAVILVHNHPSGSTQPSGADGLMTQTLKQALEMIDVRVIDHMIVAGAEILSMAENGLM